LVSSVELGDLLTGLLLNAVDHRGGLDGRQDEPLARIDNEGAEVRNTL
jgi:hypothetical protein